MKKSLLNESEIRKMMKIANLTPLASGVISKLSENYGMGEDMFTEGEGEDEELEMDMGDPPLEADPGDEDDAPMPDPAPEAAAPEATAADADPEMVKGLVMDLIDMVMSAAEEKFGDSAPEGEITDLGADDDMADPTASMADAGVEAPAPAGDDAMDMPPEPADDDLANEGISLEEDNLEEDFVNEVTRRVAKRLIKASRARKTN